MSDTITVTTLLPLPVTDRVRTVGAIVTSGTVEIQTLIGATWVTVPNGGILNNEVKSFYHSANNDMRILITGVAIVSVS